MILARLFSWLDRVLGPRRGAAGEREVEGIERPHLQGTGAPSFVVALRPGPGRGEPLPWACLLSVDGGGQFLVASAPRLTLGHLRSNRADLLFLADVGALHAELSCEDSLQAGPGWRIAPAQGESVLVAGQRVGPGGRRLTPDDRVRLGANLEFRYGAPDPSSSSACLELLRAAECEGARHILLLGDGPGGRVLMGSAARHHVRVPSLDFEIQLERDGDELLVQSEFPLLGADSSGERCRLPFPPRARTEFRSGAPRGSRPAFAFSIEPVGRGGRA